MKTATLLILGLVMGVGFMTITQKTLDSRTAEAEQAAHERHCQAVNMQVITEFDELIAQKKFPTNDQQDYWRQITSSCQDEVKP